MNFCETTSVEELSMMEGNIYLRSFSSPAEKKITVDQYSQTTCRQLCGEPLQLVNFLGFTVSIWSGNVPLRHFSQTNCLYLEGKCSEWVNVADKVW